ncbi:unnamed protein product [Ectocarpus sp. 12 AP-2014]
MWSPDRTREQDHRQKSQETSSWAWIHPQRIATTARMAVTPQRLSKVSRRIWTMTTWSEKTRTMRWNRIWRFFPPWLLC